MHTEYHGTVLQAKGLNLTLGGNHILRDLDCEVRNIVADGQKVAVLGRSGVGKTQLFRILAGLQEPDTGTVVIGDPAEPVKVGKLGVVFQQYQIFPHYHVIENLTLAGRMTGLSRRDAREKALVILEDFGLSEIANRYPVGTQISGGQKQRVAIMQQIMCSEHFLLMDEPFSGLDPGATDRVCRRIDKIASADDLNTIIVVTHDVAAAAQIADEIWVMGREKNLDGTEIPGARIVKKYDLRELDLVYYEGITNTPKFFDFVREVRAFLLTQ